MPASTHERNLPRADSSKVCALPVNLDKADVIVTKLFKQGVKSNDVDIDYLVKERIGPSCTILVVCEYLLIELEKDGYGPIILMHIVELCTTKLYA